MSIRLPRDGRCVLIFQSSGARSRLYPATARVAFVTAHVFIGFDSKEVVAYHVLVRASRNASIPVSFTPIALDPLGGIFTRERNRCSRPSFLSRVSSFHISAASKVGRCSATAICSFRADIAELWSLRDENLCGACAASTITSQRRRQSSSARCRPNTRRRTGRALCCSTSRCAALTPEYVEHGYGPSTSSVQMARRRQ